MTERAKRGRTAPPSGDTGKPEGLAQSFQWKDRYTPEEREFTAIHEALIANPGRDARVKRFRKPEDAAGFAERLGAAHPDLDVFARGYEVFAKAGDSGGVKVGDASTGTGDPA